MRYETKIPVSGISAAVLENIIKINRACFTEAYPERRVNNIYFDDLDMSSYFDNLNGLEKRVKYRIRWYGEKKGLINNPYLELKIKSGFTGYKEIYKLPEFRLDENTSCNDIIYYLQCSSLPELLLSEMRIKKPVLFNSYLRKYFISFDKKIRLTLDKEIEYSKIEKGGFNFRYHDDLLVIELKYEKEDCDIVQQVISELPFRIDKNSKFSRGVLHISE